MAKPTGLHPSREGAGFLYFAPSRQSGRRHLPGTMRAILARAMLPIAGYWSALLSFSLLAQSRADVPPYALPVIVLAGLPLVLFASIRLFRDAHATGSLLAMRDDLTGLGNRHAFILQSQRLMRRAKAGSIGLILMDVDGLKRLNDMCGHQAGDELLIKVSRHIDAQTKLYRIGGDEFAILVDRSTGEHMSRIMQALDPFVAEFDACGHAHEVRVSFGTTSNREGEKFQDLFRRADDSLIQHKRQLYSQGRFRDRRANDERDETVASETVESRGSETGRGHLKLLG